jgi:hypothetical protein
MFKHPNGSETYFVAEQVSHHPPISAFYASNRKEGYVINCSILVISLLTYLFIYCCFSFEFDDCFLHFSS